MFGSKSGQPNRQLRPRQSSGSGLFEIISLALLLPSIAVLAINCVFVAFAAGHNQLAARTACRAAAAQTSEKEAKLAAETSIKDLTAGAATLISGPKLEFADNGFQFVLKKESNNESTDVLESFVRVTTRSELKLPLPVIFIDDSFTDTVTLKSTEVFPILENQPIDAENSTDADGAMTASSSVDDGGQD